MNFRIQIRLLDCTMKCNFVQKSDLAMHKKICQNDADFIALPCITSFKSFIILLQVLSMKLDEWTDEQVDSLTDGGGNSAINIIYEAFLPNYIQKPRPDSSIEERTDFIR